MSAKITRPNWTRSNIVLINVFLIAMNTREAKLQRAATAVHHAGAEVAEAAFRLCCDTPMPTKPVTLAGWWISKTRSNKPQATCVSRCVHLQACFSPKCWGWAISSQIEKKNKKNKGICFCCCKNKNCSCDNNTSTQKIPRNESWLAAAAKRSHKIKINVKKCKFTETFSSVKISVKSLVWTKTFL